MYCTKCGSKVQEEAAFCVICGSKIEKSQVDKSEAAMNDNTRYASPVSENQISSSLPMGQPVQMGLLYDQTNAPVAGQMPPMPPMAPIPPVMPTMPMMPMPPVMPVRKKKRGRKWIAVVSIVLVVALLVQLFAYPFLIQKISWGKISPLAIGTVKSGEKPTGGVSAMETGIVRAYASNIRNAYAWQLMGHERKLYDLLSAKMNAAPSAAKTAGSTGFNINIDIEALFIQKAYAATDKTKEQVASDIASVAMILQQRGYSKLALALTAAAAAESTLDPMVINNLASALRAEGLNEDGYKLLSYAYKLQPGNPLILVNMGNAALDMGDVDTASTWFDEALVLDTEFGLAHEGLMLCYMSQKNYPVAMRHMIKASKECFTPAIQKTYDYLSNLENYDEIRDQVMPAFPLNELGKLYQRSRQGEAGGAANDMTSSPLEIPNFPTYGNAEAFMGRISDMHDYAMSILTPGMDILKEIEQYGKQVEGALNSFQSGDYLGTFKSISGLAGQNGQKLPAATVDGGALKVPVSNEREQFTMSLMSDYVEMRTDKFMKTMNEKMEKSSDPLILAMDRSNREIESRGEKGWLDAMAKNWGNSFALDNSTIKQNKVSINQHIDAFYGAVIPAYNEMKPLLEDYWNESGKVVKYVSNESAFKSMSLQRRIVTTGNLATFAAFAEIEAIYVPMTYGMIATGGDAPGLESGGEGAQKLDMPKDEQKGPDVYVTVDLEIVKVTFADDEISAEFDVLLTASVSHQISTGTTTLALTGGISTGDLPGVSAGASEGYYMTLNKGRVTDHGYLSSYSYGVNAGIGVVGTSYTTTVSTKVSNVTSAVESTVEKAVNAKLGFMEIGAKKSG